MDFSSMSDEELLKPDTADGNVRPSNISALSDEELLKPDAPNVSGMSDEELLKPDGDRPKPELGIFERMALEQKAKTGNEASVLDFLPVIGGMRNAEQNQQEAAEQKLYSGDYRDTLEASKWAHTAGLSWDEIKRINGLGDEAAVRKGFSDAVKDRFAARIKTREEAQRKLQGAEEAGTVEKIVSGTITGGATVLEFANPVTMAAGTAGKIINGIGDKGRDIYTLDENGNPVIAKDEKGKELRGDRSERAAAGVITSKYAEMLIWTRLGLNQLGGLGVKILDKIPGVRGLVAKGTGKVAGATESVIRKIATTEGGRLALETGRVIGKVNDTLHFGSLPDMMYKSHLTELTDVLLASAPEERKGNFKQWLDKFTSIEGNAEMLTGIIGIHLLTAGYGALRARGNINAYRHLDANGRRGGREEFVAEYIGKDAAKRLDNTDLENIYTLLTSPELSEGKINEFLQKIDADAKAAKEKIDGGESVTSVIEGIREKMNAGSEGIKTAAERIRETLENKKTLTPEMEDALDGKISEYTRELGTAAEPMAKMVKDDILSNVKDNAVYEQPEMLDELVAMSLRKFNSEGRRLRIHDVRGEKNAGAQLRTISELGITSWEQAETEGLVTKDKYGRYGGGARRALNIALHGSEKLQTAVRDGKISGETAERLLTASQCELGARPIEEQTALVDGILERAKGDEALARRMLDKLESGTEALPHEKLSETLDRLAEESKADAIAERNGVAKETAQGVAVEPVETADGQIKTVGEIVDAGAASGQTTEPKPTTALGGAEQADRLAGTKLTVFNGTTMSCETFPEAKVEVSADGITVRGLTADTMAKPDQVADVAAFVTHLMRIAKRNGKTVQFEDADAATIAQALVKEIAEKGAEKAMAKLETRGRLFGLLFKTTLGNGVTYDEASFKKALEKVGNGRQFVNNHGDVYGFVDAEGVIHFNPATFNMDTPIHEYGHVALEATKKINNALWRKGNELIKGSRYYRELLEEIERDKNSPYRNMNEEWLCDEALARLIGDEGAKLVESKGLDAQLKSWLKEVWKSFKGALGIADLTEEQIEKMTIREFADTLNAELLKGSEFGAKKKTPPSQKSIRRYDEQTDSGSSGVLRWKNDRGYLFAIPVDMERTQPGGKVVFATDDANITDWIQNTLSGYTLRLSKSGKLYVEGRDGLPPELAEIFGRYPTIGQNDGIYEELSPEARGVRYDSPETLVDALRKDRANYDAWAQGRAEKDAEAQHYADQQEREAFQRWEDSGMSVMDYIRSRVEEGDPEFDLDWETARELEREAAEVPFSVRRGGSAAERERAKFSVANKKPWDQNFPKVVVNTTLGTIKSKYPTTFKLAKSGDREAAAKIIKSVVKVDKIKDLAAKHPNARIVAVHAEEMTGRNQLPIQYAFYIESLTGLKADDDIVQSVRAHHTGADGFDRFARRAEFSGYVEKGREYILVDDHVTQGGTLSELRHFIENNGGKVVAISTLTASQGSTILPVQKSTLAKLVEKYEGKSAQRETVSPDGKGDRGPSQGSQGFSPVGEGILADAPVLTELLRRGNIAGSVEALTESEAQYILRFRPEEFRRRIETIEKDLHKDTVSKSGKFSIGGLYTGSAADYEKPSLLKVGTGEGSQVYGWGLYASSKRGVAESYLPPKDQIERANQYREYLKRRIAEETDPHEKEYLEFNLKEAEKARPTQSVYEQTFFTNRAPGDESHLLKWYEPVSRENIKRIRNQLATENLSEGNEWLHDDAENDYQGYRSDEVYKHLSRALGSQKAASEFLARADIDGIKYPVDSYGKTVKDGDKAGWNYVSFRDDNIDVDHKWVDGQAKFSIGPSALGDGKQKYYEVPFDKAVDKIVAAKKAVSDDHVFISETSNPLKEIGVPALPMMMNQKHIISCYYGKGDGVKAKDLHGLGTKLKMLPSALQHPIMIIASETRPHDSVVSIVKMVDKKGHQIFVPVEINGIGRIGEGRINANIVTSAYGRPNTWSEMVANAIRNEVEGKVSVFYVDKNEASKVKTVLAREAFNFGRSEVQFLSRSRTSNVVHSIDDSGSPVKVDALNQTQTSQFKNWFGKSKIVDEDGTPKVLYHGTTERFTVFDRTKGRSTMDIQGMFFSPWKEDADAYGDNVGAFYLSIQNPAPENVAWQVLNSFKGQNNAGVKAREELQRRGYDGVDFGGQEYIAFEPSQIKSATDNIGTFDPSNPDVRFSTGNRGGNAAEPDLAFDPAMIVYNPKLKAMGETEQNRGGIAAGIEKKEALRPWTRKGSPCDLAKPIAMDCADMVQLFRAVSGSTRNPIIRKGDHIPGRPNAIGLNRGGSQIELANRLFGMVDASDVGKLKADCTTDGYFRNENPDWCAAQTKDTVQKEVQRSRDELDRRTRELIRHRVATGEGGMHYATQVLGHEIGHTIAMLPRDKNLGSVGNAMRTLFDSMQREMKRALDPLRRNKGEPNLTEEVDKLITGWHGAETLPNYFKKPQEKFAELFGIFLTQPEYVHTEAPKAYDALVKMMGQNEKLALAYRRINEAKWNGTSNKRVMAELEKTWKKEQQDQFRKLNQLAREPISKARDWFNYALNDRFGPMFAMSQRSLKAEKKRLKQAVKEGAMSAEEAAERIRTREAEINALKTSLFDWQRQTGGATRLMMADLDDVIRTAERDGVNWDNVRKYAHLNRVIELGGRATAHGIDPSRAAAMLGDMARELGAENWTKVEKTWKAYRAVYERHVLEDGKVREMFGEDVMKFLDANKHYVTMKHRMSAEESAEWMARIEEYRAKNKNAWDPTIDLWERMNRGLKGQSGVNAGFKLHTLEGSFEATEDPIAATMMTALSLKENAARNHLLKTMSQTLRDCGVKGVYDTAMEKGAKEHAVDPGVYERLTYMDGGVKHELIVPLVIGKSFTTKRALPRAVDFIGGTMRFLRNTMTLWNPAFINRAYLIDKSSLETNIEGMHKPAIDVLSEALCFRGIGVPLYMVNNYLARFTPIANTWLGKILWNEHTVNHYAHRAQKVARMIYEGKFSDRLEEARKLREQGYTGEATEIEQNVTIAREMMKKNVFQSLYEFNVEQSGLETAEILNKFGYRLEGGERPKSWYGKAWTKVKNAAKIYNRFEEEQEAVTKIVAYLYRMKVDEEAGRTSAADVDARARLVIEQGGTPNLSARGVLAGAIENATGFFWNVRKEGFLRTVDALKDHPAEWIAKNFAQTAMPALLKGMIVTGCMELLIKKFFDDDDEKIKESWWAPAVLDHCRFVNSAMKCVPGYYQRNYNVIPLAKFGDEVLSLRVKYSPEEFAIQNAIHTAMQKFGADPTDPSADWSTLSENMMNEFLPNIFGRNYALDSIGALVGPLVGVNPYDQFRQRHIYDENLFKARALRKGDMAKEMVKSFWNYSPLGSFGGKLTDELERKDFNDELPEWLDGVLSTPFVKMIPASMLTITSKDSFIKGLKDVDQEQRAAALVHAHDILVESIRRGSLGGFTEGLKDVPNEYRGLAVRHVLNGWRQWHMDPASKQLKSIRGIKDPELKRRAWQILKDGEKYQD